MSKNKKKLSDSLKLLINYISDPVIVLGSESKIVGVNKAMRTLIDAIPSGDKITIDSIEIKNNTEIHFSDNEPGISEEILPKLFTPLCSTKTQGMEFGLVIYKRIVDANYGRISVKSINAKGTTFTIAFPINQKIEDGGGKIWINLPESS